MDGIRKDASPGVKLLLPDIVGVAVVSVVILLVALVEVTGGIDVDEFIPGDIDVDGFIPPVDPPTVVEVSSAVDAAVIERVVVAFILVVIVAAVPLVDAELFVTPSAKLTTQMRNTTVFAIQAIVFQKFLPGNLTLNFFRYICLLVRCPLSSDQIGVVLTQLFPDASPYMAVVHLPKNRI